MVEGSIPHSPLTFIYFGGTMNKRRKRFRLKNASLKEICRKYPYKVVSVTSRSNDTVLQLDKMKLVFTKK